MVKLVGFTSLNRTVLIILCILVSSFLCSAVWSPGSILWRVVVRCSMVPGDGIRSWTVLFGLTPRMLLLQV